MRRIQIGPIVIGGILAAIAAFAVCTYEHTPDKLKYVLSAPPGMIVTVLGFCGDSKGAMAGCGPGASSKVVAVFLGTFFLFYFTIGAVVALTINAFSSKSKRMER
jgi:hypothetical protein